MTTFDRRGLNGLLFAVTVLLGVLLLPARLPARALVVGAAVVALVLAGVFLPTFSMQILNGVLSAAVFIVAVMWSVALVVRRRRSRAPPAASAVSACRACEAASGGGRADQCVDRHFKCSNLQIVNCRSALHLASRLALALCVTAYAVSLAAEGPAPPPERATREIYVPFSDLHVLLEQQPKRVLLSREEYDDLGEEGQDGARNARPPAGRR